MPRYPHRSLHGHRGHRAHCVILDALTKGRPGQHQRAHQSHRRRGSRLQPPAQRAPDQGHHAPTHHQRRDGPDSLEVARCAQTAQRCPDRIRAAPDHHHPQPECAHPHAEPQRPHHRAMLAQPPEPHRHIRRKHHHHQGRSVGRHSHAQPEDQIAEDRPPARRRGEHGPPSQEHQSEGESAGLRHMGVRDTRRGDGHQQAGGKPCPAAQQARYHGERETHRQHPDRHRDQPGQQIERRRIVEESGPEVQDRIEQPDRVPDGVVRRVDERAHVGRDSIRPRRRPVLRHVEAHRRGNHLLFLGARNEGQTGAEETNAQNEGAGQYDCEEHSEQGV